MTFPLLYLPEVVLRQLISGGYLDPESTLFVGVTCSALNKIVSKQISSRGSEYWQSLLDGVGTFTKDLVQVEIYLIWEKVDRFKGGDNPDQLWGKGGPGPSQASASPSDHKKVFK